MTESKKNTAWADCCEDWGGYMVAKKAKLEEQFDERAKAEFSDPTTLFNGIAIFVNGYTNPTADELKRLMMAHGGIYHHYLRPHTTTHLIASNLPYTKIVAYRKAQKPLPLCKPEWITDSIKAGKVLDYRDYLLYSQCTKNQPAIFSHLTKQMKPKPETIVSSSSISSSSCNGSLKINPQVPNYSAVVTSKTEVTKIREKETSNVYSGINSKPPSSTSNSFTNENLQSKITVNSNLAFSSEVQNSKATSEEKKVVPQAIVASTNETQKTSLASCTVTSMSSKNPQFLTEFFSNSRLHHIATMGAIFKDYINDLRDKSNGKFPGLEALRKKSHNKHCNPGISKNANDSDSDDDFLNGTDEKCNSMSRPISPILCKKKPIIMHIDMDCFFVSVGLRNHPELRGFPVAVAHSKGNKHGSSESDEHGSMSEVASCSYEARQAGVKNGMFLGQALKLCPNLKTIRYDFEGYKVVSYSLYDTIASYTLDIEAVSCDEMYVDCTKILEASGLSPMDFASILRNEIKQKTGCPVSTGFGENKLLARLATKKAKPDGQFHLVGTKAINFIRTLNVRDLPGVGYTTSKKLKQMNVITCAELESVSLYKLKKEFKAVIGQQLHDMCRGIDNSKLNLEHVRKSISAEANYGIRFESTEEAHEFLKKLSEEISDRLKTYDLKGRCITLKLMFRSKDAPEEPRKFMGHGVCDAFNKSKNLIAATDDPVIITREVMNLWNQINKKPEDARGIGIQMTKLESLRHKSTESTIFKFLDKKTSIMSVTEPQSSKQNTAKEQTEKPSSLKDNQKLNEKKGQDDVNLDERLLGEVQLDCENVENFQEKNVVYQLPEKNSNQSKEELNNKLPVKETANRSSQPKKSTQPEYFKIIKPSTKVNKFKMPDIQEIDMKVLIELPDDIRNEIINEYKRNQENESKRNNNENFNKNDEYMGNDINNINIGVDDSNVNNNNNENPPEFIGGLEENISFSQIDPEFLAALPNDMKDEVKSYFDAQKRARNIQTKEKSKNMANRGWDMFKNNKVINKKPNELTRTKRTYAKSKPGKLKVHTGSKKETKSKVVNFNNKNLEDIKSVQKNQEDLDNNIPSRSSQDAVNQTVYFEPSDENPEHSEILTSLVNCLLELPISQVKLQIRQWIFNNSDINDVDFLSLTTYLGTLPKKGRIEDLFILTKCLHRCTLRSESCIWHETYRKIIKHVQIKMRAVFNYDLFVQEIDCTKCNCTKSD